MEEKKSSSPTRPRDEKEERCLFNPFSETTSPDFISRYFVGRENYLRRFRRRIEGLKAHTPNHFYIAGVHGTGKTTFLAKLKDLSMGEDCIAVLPTPDEGPDPRKQMSTVLRSIVQALNDAIEKEKGSSNLVNTWDLGAGQNLFLHPRGDVLETDAVLHDLQILAKMQAEAHAHGIVICIDEGQRLQARVLSALKNTLQHLSSYLVVISLRLDFETDDPVQAGRVMLDQMAQQAEKDHGASRFYVNGISMGPFDGDSEAFNCVEKRLEGNAIQFDQKVIELIARISGRMPRSIIEESSRTYELALAKQVDRVTPQLFKEAFRAHHKAEVLEAANLCAAISDAGKRALTGLLKIGSMAKPETIASFLYPGVGPELLNASATGIKLELDRIIQKTNFVVAANEAFLVSNPVRAYALDLALGVEN